MLCRDLAAQQRDDVTVLALIAHPGIVFLFGDDIERYLHMHIVGLEEQFLQDFTASAAVGLDQHAEGQRMMDIGLTYVENRSSVTGQYAGQGGSDTRLIGSRNVDLNQLPVLSHYRFFL